MREFDTNGLRIAEYQGRLFELSRELDCSTAIFLRRFKHSNLLIKLDKNDSSLLSLDPIEGISEITEQYGESSYGSVKKSKDSLFWVGFFYRYLSYTRNISTRLLFELFNYEKMFELYYVYHTQDFEWCVSDLLEIYGYNESIFDPNYRLKQAILKSGSKLYV